MKLGELVSGDVIGVAPEQSVRSAAEIMWEHKIGSLIVQDAGELSGILTERDVLKAMATAIDPDETPVRELMTKDVVTVGRDWEVHEAAVEMSARNIRHLVLSDDGDVVGILSIRDLLLAGERLELSDKNWAILRNPLAFTVRERRVLHRCLQKLRGADDAPDVDELLGLLVGNWSFDLVPGDPDALRSIPPKDYDVLRATMVAQLPDLQRAVHPAPGWRRRTRDADNGNSRRAQRATTGEKL